MQKKECFFNCKILWSLFKTDYTSFNFSYSLPNLHYDLVLKENSIFMV